TQRSTRGNTLLRRSRSPARPASSRAVERRRSRGRLGDSFAQLRRLEHLGVGPEAEQLAVRVVERLEADGDATVGLDALGVAEVAADVHRDANGHLDPRPPLLEGARPLVPERL